MTHRDLVGNVIQIGELVHVGAAATSARALDSVAGRMAGPARRAVIKFGPIGLAGLAEQRRFPGMAVVNASR
ncbi:MAG TPA: hypothetical protein VH158_07320 [Gemmatimonadales bacterium]|nr:hypothetical protein [Gemmatimonadales bacterium]